MNEKSLFRVISSHSSPQSTIQKIESLIASGADVNEVNEYGKTPIMVASVGPLIGDEKIGHLFRDVTSDLSKPSVVKALIKAGADLSAKDNKGHLVTDLADKKALPVLVAAGAPVNVKSKTALMTAVRAKDLALTQDLLQRGLKKKLKHSDLRQNLPFLQTVAQSFPDLFQKGFSLEDTERQPADKKTAKAFKVLLDVCSAEPKNHSTNATDESSLPPSLRLSAWPPRRPDPTGHIQVIDPPKSAPQFRPPNHLVLEYDKAREKSENSEHVIRKISEFISKMDVVRKQLTKRLDYISHYQPEISGSIVHLYDKEDLLLYINTFNYIKSGFFDNFGVAQYAALAERLGNESLEGFIRLTNSGSKNALRVLSYFDAPEAAAFMSGILIKPESFVYGQAWLRNFPSTAIKGLLACSFGSDLNDRSNAQQALRLLARSGLRQAVIDCAFKFGQEAKAVAIEFLGYDSRADFLPKKLPKLPPYFIASAHPAPKLKSSGEALPRHAVETLVRMMLVSTCHLQNSALQEVIEACDRSSLAEFALSAFDVWSRNGAKKDGIGFLYALAYLGDDRAAVMLAKTYKNATPTAVAPAVEVLASIGSNTALAGLQAIARSNLNETSQGIAKHALDDVARDRGLSPDMLEDLAVPDLGLDQNGQRSLDFGPRQFLVTLDAGLEASLSDEDGNVLKALPKANKADNAQMAKTATAQWKEFKAALKGQARDQKSRFEQAMLGRREWDGATFKELVVGHPLLLRMVRNLVWATVEEQKLQTPFRIDADGRYTTVDGAELCLGNEARVTLPHPLLLANNVDSWLRVFADNKLTQPFPQLARKWFAEGPETQALIKARDGTKVPLGSLRGLKAKGWDFEEGGAGMVWSVYKFAEGARASIDVEPGWSLSGYDFEDFGGDQTVKLDVSGSDPIAYSELVREFLSLPVSES